MLHLSSFLPPEAFGLVQQTFNSGSHNVGKLTFGALIALWSATAGMAAARDALNAVPTLGRAEPIGKSSWLHFR